MFSLYKNSEYLEPTWVGLVVIDLKPESVLLLKASGSILSNANLSGLIYFLKKNK